jgi:hypothetical protein
VVAVNPLTVNPFRTGRAVAALVGDRYAAQVARRLTLAPIDPVLTRFAKGLVAACSPAAPELLDRVGGACRLWVSERTVDRYRERGLPSRKVGGRVVFDPVDLERWLGGFDDVGHR